MNNILLYIGGFLVAILAALFAIPHFVDWNGYRGLFEAEASRIVGTEVRVGGEVNVRFLPTPYVRFEKIRIADAEAGTGESLFRADSFKMWMAVPPLLRGVVEADEVELKRPVLRLTTDKEGKVNWSGLAPSPGEFPFIPVGVSLDAVNVINGAISFIGPQGTEIAHVDKLNGQLMAEALEGPFKFKGQGNWDGAEREIRLATAKPETNGDVRFKANVSVPATGNTYAFDGRVSDIKGQPKIDGEIVAQLKLAAITGSTAQPKDTAAAPAAAKDAQEAAMEMRGKVTGDGTGFKVADIAITIEQGGPPQIITGQSATSWSNKMRIDASFDSRWLDFDKPGAPGSAGIPFVVLGSLFEGLFGVLPGEAETNLTMRVDQVNLGGDALADVALAVERAGGPMQLKEFRARVPGGGVLSADGILNPAPKPDEPKFSGNLSINGQSTMRFLAWAFKRPGITEGRGDAPYSLTGKLQYSDGSVALSHAHAEIGDMPLSGKAELGLAPKRKFEIEIEGERLDAGQFLPGIVSLTALDGLKPPPADPAGSVGVPGSDVFDFAAMDLGLKLKANTLADGERVLRDADMDIRIIGQELSLPVLRFKTDDGLHVDIEGAATGIRDKPKGTLRGLISAATPASMQALARLLDLKDNELALSQRVSPLTPLRLAGTIGFGTRNEHALDIKADGVAHSGRLTADLRLDGGRLRWRTAPADILVTLDGTNISQVLAPLFNAGAPAETAPAGHYRAAVLRAAGTPAQGLIATAAFKSADGIADFSGRVTVPEQGDHSARGTLKISRGDVHELLSMAGLKLAPGLRGTLVEGEADMVLAGGQLTLSARQLNIAGSTLGGTLSLSRPAGKAAEIAANLDIDRAGLPRLMRSMLSAGVQPGEVQNESAVLTAGLWPEETFDLAFLDQVNGSVKAKIATLALQDGLSIGDAVLDIALSPGKFAVTSLEGGAAGGKLTSQMVFDRGAAGVEVKGNLAIGIGEAAASTSGGNAAAASSFALDFSGRALSPAALMVDLKGKGEIALGDVTLSGMGPAPVVKTAEAALAGQGPAGGEELVVALKSALKQGQLRLGAIKIPVALGDGAMKLEKITIETGEGRSTFETAIELGTMKIDSEWKIEAKVAAPPPPPPASPDGVPPAVVPSNPDGLLPPVSVVYTGTLAGLSTIEPVIDATSLERELIVRKMESDVEKLEQLRRFDQSRAAQELERQKILEAERAKAAAAAAAAARAANPPPPPPAVTPAAASASNGVTEGAIVPQGEAGPGEVPGAAAAENGAAPAAPVVSAAPAPQPVKRKPPAKRPSQSTSPFPLPF